MWRTRWAASQRRRPAPRSRCRTTCARLVVIAIGVLGSPDLLPEDRRARETAPRRRIPLTDVAFTGTWGTPADL